MRHLWQQLAIATNWPVLVAVAVLVSMGTISIWAESPPEGQNQLKWVVIGVICLAAFQAVNYQIIGRFAWLFYGISFLLLLYTVLPGVPQSGFGSVPRINGARAWIRFGASASLQPAELMKISFIMVLARHLRFRTTHRTIPGLLMTFLIAAAPLAIILKQPDVGTAMVFIPAMLAMLFVAGAKVRHLAGIFAVGLAIAPVLWFAGQDLPLFRHLPSVVKQYHRERVQAMFRTDERTMRDKGFQQEHALVAMGSGGLRGKGFGNVPIGRHVPEVHNDFVFALIGEQFGFFGSAVVLVAYLVLFTAGVEISAGTKEPFGKLVALGTVALLAGQTFLNLMVATRMMPVTGVTLPFVSYGGSSLLASFMAAGLLLNIGQNRPMVVARQSFEF